MKRFTQLMAIWFTIFQLAILSLSIAAATGVTADPNSDDQHPSHRSANVFKILAVLENKIEDQQVLEKTKQKLFALNDEQTGLIVSLSDRVTKEGDTMGANIAFLLMTVLITLL